MFQFLRRRANINWSKHDVPSYAYRFDVTVNGDPPYIGATHFVEVTLRTPFPFVRVLR